MTFLSAPDTQKCDFEFVFPYILYIFYYQKIEHVKNTSEWDSKLFFFFLDLLMTEEKYGYEVISNGGIIP